MNYYDEIKTTLVKNENYKKIKDYSKNKSDLNAYYEVGRLLVEAQGGEDRAGYGNGLIKDYSARLTEELGKGYTYTGLSRMRQFYLLSTKLAPMAQQLTWSHYTEILPLKNIDEIKYYINISLALSLSKRDLRERIKSKEYERIGYKEELEQPQVNTLIKNPIIIKSNLNEEITEHALKQLILENMDSFLRELGMGFMYAGNEYKIKIGDRYNYIDILLFNYEFNCFVVVELKVTELKAEHIGQIMKYMNYANKHIKKPFHDNTAGIIICKKDNQFIMEYVSDDRIFATTYELVNSN